MTKPMPKENEKVEATLKNGMKLTGVYSAGDFHLGCFRVKPKDVRDFKVVQ